MDVTAKGLLAKVQRTEDDSHRVYLLLSNGILVFVESDDRQDLQDDEVVLYDTDSGEITSAPQDLWQFEPWIGVVKAKLDDGDFVVESSGRLFRASLDLSDKVDTGNTVEGYHPKKISRILSREPIRYIDLGGIDDTVIASFRSSEDKDKVFFGDIGGYKGVIDRAIELVELPLTKRENLDAIKARAVRGVLFTGDPGTGKTLLARAIAHESNASFYEISGPQVLSKWFGQTEELLRKIFDHATANAPAIIFFDEIDSIAGRRNEDSNEASRRVVAQLLALMDGFSSRKGVVVIATTNRPQDIDPALLRPGRFDWKIHFPMPDEAERREILDKTASKLTTEGALSFNEVASRTAGWSPADLTAIWTEAALIAAADDRFAIDDEDFRSAHARVERQRLLNSSLSDRSA